jgi:nanoRNase/pAp phosphatase (c-di-AMP/oligoRNAs hydrolase)
MEFKNTAKDLIQNIKKYKHLLIFIKGSPDPDAIASAFALKLICETVGTKSLIDSPISPSLPQNIRIIKDLHLPVQFKSAEEIVKTYDAYAVLDHPSVDIENITGVIPCAIHIDHHEESKDSIPVDQRIIQKEAGATSTLMIFLLNELKSTLNLSHSEQVRVATALYFGISTDTDNFQLATRLDKHALEIITPFIDQTIVNKINNLPFSKEAIHHLQQALKNQITHDEWLISGIGYIKDKNRDALAIIADFLLKREDISRVMVFALVDTKKGLTLDASFRTLEKKFNLNTFIKRITKDGGARTFKGAYQVNLDYFRQCPDRDILWQVVYLTTIETLKKLGVPVEVTGVKKVYDRIKKRFGAILKNIFN